jgi:hypothetical protein
VRDDVATMSEENRADQDPRAGDVMSSLPRARPQRPSRRREGGAATRGRRAAKPRAAGARAAAKPAAKAAAKTPRAASRGSKPAGVRPSAATRAATKPRAPKRPPSPPRGTDIVGTAVQAAGELAELGLTLGARALRDAVRRIPRP